MKKETKQKAAEHNRLLLAHEIQKLQEGIERAGAEPHEAAEILTEALKKEAEIWKRIAAEKRQKKLFELLNIEEDEELTTEEIDFLTEANLTEAERQEFDKEIRNLYNY